jgi:hypothetical protein
MVRQVGERMTDGQAREVVRHAILGIERVLEEHTSMYSVAHCDAIHARRELRMLLHTLTEPDECEKSAT